MPDTTEDTHKDCMAYSDDYDCATVIKLLKKM